MLATLKAKIKFYEFSGKLFASTLSSIEGQRSAHEIHKNHIMFHMLINIYKRFH